MPQVRVPQVISCPSAPSRPSEPRRSAAESEPVGLFLARPVPEEPPAQFREAPPGAQVPAQLEEELGREQERAPEGLRYAVSAPVLTPGAP